MAKRWTPEEDQEWIAFFRGETIVPPKGREICAARRRFDIPSVDKVHSSALHAMAVAASRYLPRIPYKCAGCHTRFIETVQVLAVHPDAPDGYGYPKNVLDAAVSDARKALHGVAAPQPTEIDASEQRELIDG